MFHVFLHLIQEGKKSLIKAQTTQPAKKIKDIESCFQNIYILEGINIEKISHDVLLILLVNDTII